jgi:hypothetical protein
LEAIFRADRQLLGEQMKQWDERLKRVEAGKVKPGEAEHQRAQLAFEQDDFGRTLSALDALFERHLKGGA